MTTYSNFDTATTVTLVSRTFLASSIDRWWLVTDDPAFEVEYECGNCGAEWDDSYGAETAVTQFHDEVSVNDRGTFEAGYSVVCPTCELIEGVTVVDRNPVE